MNEDEARDWLRTSFGTCAFQRLERFVSLLLAEATQQSLIARSTFDEIWSRHVADSAQLVNLAPTDGTWVDVGSGGGLPGLVVAIMRDAPLIMVEPRKKRAAFLVNTCEELGLGNTSVLSESIQSTTALEASVVSARAVASLSEIFTWTRDRVSRETTFLLPRGLHAVDDMALVKRAWHGEFHVEQSLTDPNAGIVVAKGVRPR